MFSLFETVSPSSRSWIFDGNIKMLSFSQLCPSQPVLLREETRRKYKLSIWMMNNIGLWWFFAMWKDGLTEMWAGSEALLFLSPCRISFFLFFNAFWNHDFSLWTLIIFKYLKLLHFLFFYKTKEKSWRLCLIYERWLLSGYFGFCRWIGSLCHWCPFLVFLHWKLVWFYWNQQKNKTKQQANKLNCVAMIMINISSTKPHFIFLADSDTEKLDHMLEFIGRCTKRLSSFHILFPAFFFLASFHLVQMQTIYHADLWHSSKRMLCVK